MDKHVSRVIGTFLASALFAASACAPAAQPSPTAAPAKPAATTAPAKPAEKAAEKPAAKATEKPAAKTETKPAASPAAAKPAASPAAKPAASPAAKTETKPAAKAPSFNEQAVADFYRGKTVRIVVGFSAGGGYDTYSRLIAKHLGKHIPGNPNVIVENMPGAGSMTAMNHVYNAAAKDGTTIGSVAGGLVLQQLASGPGIEYDASKMEYLGAPSFFEYLMIVSRQSGITRFEEILGPNGKEVIIGATGPGAASYNVPLVVKGVLDANIKLVAGYGGTSKIRLAMESTEVDGLFNSWDSVKITNLQNVQSGEQVVLVQLTEKPITDLPKQNVPMVMDFAQTEEQRQLLRFGIFHPNLFGRPYVVAPGVPPDRVAALQSAFMKTMEDREFLAEAQQAKQDINPLTGAELKQAITEFLGMPRNLQQRLEEILSQPGS